MERGSGRQGGGFGDKETTGQKSRLRKGILPSPLWIEAFPGTTVVLYLSLNSAAGCKHSLSRNVLCNIVALFFRVLSRDPQLQQFPPPFQRCSCSLSEQPHDQNGCVQRAQSLRQLQPGHSWEGLHTATSSLLQSPFSFWWG